MGFFEVEQQGDAPRRNHRREGKAAFQLPNLVDFDDLRALRPLHQVQIGVLRGGHLTARAAHSAKLAGRGWVFANQGLGKAERQRAPTDAARPGQQIRMAHRPLPDVPLQKFRSPLMTDEVPRHAPIVAQSERDAKGVSFVRYCALLMKR